MTVKKRTWVPLLLVLGLAFPAQAAEKSKSLKDRIRSVSNRMYGKAGRLEVTAFPLTSMSLNDAFYQKLGGGIGLGYHLSEGFSIQALFTYSLNLETNNATAYTISPTGETLIPFAGKRSLLAGADFCWSPVYGKISLAAEWILHFDTYLMGGVAFIGGEQTDDRDSYAFAADFGLGVRVFFSPAVALKLEIKDYMVFNDQVSFGDIEKSDVQHQLLFNLGLSFFFLDGSGED